MKIFYIFVKNKYNEGNKNFRLKNIIKGITKEGELGKSFFERNKTLVDLSTSLLPKKEKKEIKQLINENMDPEGRSYKNAIKNDDGRWNYLILLEIPMNLS